ncbi:hypothetical protein B0H11DRAFT_2076711 [Mycena galericulata]|nr:hypothetical protein B0H11DRAFT_2076711 [Mycena galericulata]
MPVFYFSLVNASHSTAEFTHFLRHPAFYLVCWPSSSPLFWLPCVDIATMCAVSASRISDLTFTESHLVSHRLDGRRSAPASRSQIFDRLQSGLEPYVEQAVIFPLPNHSFAFTRMTSTVRIDMNFPFPGTSDPASSRVVSSASERVRHRIMVYVRSPT